MGSSNTFSRAMKHLKADKPSGLFESVPTNNTQDLYQVEPDTLVEINPDIDVPDFDQDGGGASGYTGTDTSGLFMPDGTIRVIEPPGDTSAILGPMASMWYAWGNFSTFGYIRQSDRKMVNLGRITGKLSDWDGVSDFTSYNNDFTIDQAVWFRDTPKYGGISNDPAEANYRAFYPGPPSNTPDQYGRYYCTTTGTPKNQTTGVKGPKVGPDGAGFPWGMIGDALKGLGNLFGDTLSAIQGTGAAQFLARALRSLTDSAVYAGDYIFKGLAEGVEYLPDFTGAGDLFGIKVPKIADWPGALARTIGGGDNAVSQFLDNAVQGVLGENYATQYFTPDLDTAVKYAGESGTVVAIPRTEGMTGWKNWFGSDVSRGFDPSKGVEQLVSSADAVAADAAGATQQFALNSADDVAALQQLASKGSKANSLLGKLGRAVPFVGAAAATADVSIRTANGDYAGAVLGGISAIPGPVGWVGLGAQVISDVTGVTDPNSASNQFLGAVFGGQSTSGRGAGRAAFQEEYLLTEEEQLENFKAMREALFELGLPKDIKEFAKQQTIYLMAMGVNPGLVSVIARTIVGEKLTDKEKKYIKNKFPALIAIMVGGAEAKAKKVVKDHKGIHNVKLASTAKLPKFAPQKTMKPSGVNESHTLDVIKNIKKPVVIEEKKEKVKRRPRVIGSEPRTLNTGLMKQAEVPASFKKPEERMWGKYEREQNARASQDRKNVVLDHLGNADQAWEYLLDRNAGKRSFAGYFEKDGTPRTIFTDGKVKTVTREEKIGTDTLIFFTDEEGKSGSILQSEYNELQDQAHTQQIFAEYEATVAAEEETPFDKIVDRLELRAEKNPTNGKIESMLSSYRALSHLRKEDKKQEAHFTSWKSSIDGTITSNFQSWVDSVGQETADAVTKVALAEKMSSANLFGSNLPATGETINHTINIGNVNSFDSEYTDIPGNQAGIDNTYSTSHNQPSNVFPGFSGGDDILYFSIPHTETGGYSNATVDYFMMTTKPMKLENDTLSFRAISGNSTGSVGTGMGSNGGTQPWKDLSVYWFSYDANGEIDDIGLLGTVPKDTHSSTQFEFTFPANLVGKQVAVNFYNNANTGGFEGSSFLQGFSIPWHPLGTLDERSFGDYSDGLAWSILNYDTIQGEGYGTLDKTTLAYFLWSDLQGHHTSTSYWGYQNSFENPGAPAPVSGSQYSLGLLHPETEEDIGMTMDDLNYIVNWIETNMSHLKGQTTTTYAVSDLNFKRKAPMNVYVPLDSPEAINFIRTAPEMAGLTPAQRLKKLKEMLAAGNEYLVKLLGYQGSTATPGPNEPADYLDGADELLNDVSPEEQAEIEKNLAKLGPEYAQIAAIPAALPLLASPAGQAALAAGAAAVGTLLIQAGINVSGTDWGAAPGRDTVGGGLPGTGGTAGGRELTPDQQAEVEAAGDELRDARRALEDLPDDATQSERDMAQERLDKASKNRQRVRNKHKQENKNRKN